MSKRFGRNQRRQAREALAVEKAKVAVAVERVRNLTWEMTVARQVAKGREELLRKVQAELAGVREAVVEAYGPHSMLLPPAKPTDGTYCDALPEYLQMRRREPLSMVYDDTAEIRAVAHADMCHVLSVELEDDHWARLEHIYIVDRHRRILGYAIPETAARATPMKVLRQHALKVLAEALPRKLKDDDRG